MIRILFAEDEPFLGQLVKEALENKKDLTVTWITDGAAVLPAFSDIKPQLCILDVMLPGKDGFTIAKEIRKMDEHIPILFLTARSQTTDVVKGFEIGGNDYLKKPFSIAELIARIRELLRRVAKNNYQSSAKDSFFTIGKYEFQPDIHVLKCGDIKYNLTNRETELLKKLVVNKNSLMERNETLLELWGDESFFHARNMDVYITKLRKYLIHDPKITIVNIRGFGYKLIDES